MSIEKLYKKNRISVRSYHICMRNDFNSINDLKEYLFEKESFMDLRNCGRKSNEELIGLAIKYSDDDFKDKNDVVQVENPLKTIISKLSLSQKKDVNDLICVNTNSLSVRSSNAISHYLDGNFKIKNFGEKILYSDCFDIKSLKNVGAKSIPEISIYISIIKEYLIKVSKNSDKKDVVQIENPLKIIVSNLSLVQREIINNFIRINTSSLSVRSANAISHYLGANFKIKNFAEKILYSDYFDINNLKNIGAKSVPEISLYISIVKEYLINVSKSDDEKYLINLKNSFLIKRLFPDVDIPNEILNTESIFYLIEFLLNKNALFDKTQTIIFKYAFKVYANQEPKSLEVIADIVDLSRERVRQLRNTCSRELFERLTFIQNFDEDLYEKYSIDIDANDINIDENTIEIINDKNKTFFSKEFIVFLSSILLEEKFFLIGYIEDVLQENYFRRRNRYRWQNFYLINKKIAQEFEFDSFVNDIYKRINKRIDEVYSFNFKSYLSRFMKNNEADLLNKLSPIAEKIINNEFELYLNLNDELIFSRNTLKSAYEYAYEALEEIGEPSHINEIYKKVSEIHPNYDTNEEKLRSAMQRSKIFTPVSRTSVYGLKKWENKWEDFKGGSMRDIVIEKLIKSNRPLHIVELLNEVHKYREETNIRNLITNLKLENNNLYIFFNQNFVGLSSKRNKYNINKYESIPKQLGKEIISKYNQGYSIDDIKIYLKRKYDLSFYESELIINNLDYFNESK